MRADYGAYDIEILAEINNAPRLDARAVRAARRLFPGRAAPTSSTSDARRASPSPPWATWCASSARRGMRVSVDSFDPSEIRTAVEAGAELVLSVNGSNLDVARELAGTRRAGGGDSRLRRGPRHAWTATHRGARAAGASAT